MNQTTNLHLPQFAESDRIHHDDFNDAFDKIDAAVPRIVFGTYTGNEAAERVISLPFTPKLVYLCNESGMTYYSGYEVYGGLALTEHPAKSSGKIILEIVENGFRVGTDGIKRSNDGGCTYFYFAIG